MNIGFFGDSYVDVTKSKWPGDLIGELDAGLMSSGMGGANQYYAVDTWNQVQTQLANSNNRLDYAIWTFTWVDRLYRETGVGLAPIVEVMLAWAERREPRVHYENEKEIKQAIGLYFKYLHDKPESLFYYTLMLKWILALPAQYPNTRFIFIPNTEVARKIALTNFDQGVLLDFAFETLSNRETASPCVMPCDCRRLGHLNETNHDRVRAMVKDLVVNYEQYRNTIYQVDYSRFDIAA